MSLHTQQMSVITLPSPDPIFPISALLTLWRDRALLWGCPVHCGHWAASVASTHWISIAPPPQLRPMSSGGSVGSAGWIHRGALPGPLPFIINFRVWSHPFSVNELHVPRQSLLGKLESSVPARPTWSWGMTVLPTTISGLSLGGLREFPSGMTTQHFLYALL